MIRYDKMSTGAVMSIHRFMKVVLAEPHGCLRYPNGPAHLAEVERVLLLRVPVLHLWEMEKVQRDNNIRYD